MTGNFNPLSLQADEFHRMVSQDAYPLRAEVVNYLRAETVIALHMLRRDFATVFLLENFFGRFRHLLQLRDHALSAKSGAYEDKHTATVLDDFFHRSVDAVEALL